MAHLAEIVKDTVLTYASGGSDLETFVLSNQEKNIYAVLVTDVPVQQQPMNIVVSARVIGDKVVIDEDTTDRPLIDALVQKGIPRENIICAYAGEAVPVVEEN